MSRSQEDRLRGLLGEAIPASGSDADTMFTDEEITDFLERATAVNQDFTLEAAAFYGWQEKMANYAGMVTVSEGNASRELTELHRNAQRMVEQFRGYVPTPGRGRARIGKLARESRN